jgi:hypothetical protein
MPSRFLQAITRAFYVLCALILGGAALKTIWEAVANLADGCELVFSQADLVEPPTTGPIPDNLPACQQYVDLLPIILGLAGCIVVLATAIRFGHLDGRSRLVVGAGALVGTAVSAFPMAIIWWASAYYDDALPDALGLAIGAVPLLVGLVSAWVTWRVHGRREGSIQPSPA